MPISILTILIVVGIIVVIIVFSFITGAISLWMQALISGASVGLFNIIFMRFRKVPPKLIVECKIMATKAGIQITTDELESHYLAGGNVLRVVQALIAADRARIPLNFNRAAAIDLAGRNVLEAVQMSVNPKVIETPRVAAVAKDGIQLTAITRVTVRANIDRLVGGAGEETILARVGEGIVTTIGSAVNHKMVLEKGLDAGTAFEILSIDIADVDVGKNIGAELETDRAEADKKIAQAKAEERRAMAIAAEQEMRAKLVEAEAQIPLAIAEALKSGNIGVMDYYRMKNILADTRMREIIGGGENKEKPSDSSKKENNMKI